MSGRLRWPFGRGVSFANEVDESFNLSDGNECLKVLKFFLSFSRREIFSDLRTAAALLSVGCTIEPFSLLFSKSLLLVVFVLDGPLPGPRLLGKVLDLWFTRDSCSG